MPKRTSRLGGRSHTHRLRSSAGLTYTQVFLLVIGFGLASGVIFLFGMWVGRDIAERRLAQEERIVRAPVPVVPTTALEEPKEQEVDRAFYERLKDKAVQRLQDTPLPSPTSGHALPAGGTPGAPLATRTRPLIFDMPTERPTPRSTNTPRPRPTATSGVARPPQGLEDENDWADAGWTVQVNATTDQTEAHELAQRLREKGFDAYTVQAPTRGGATWYRVRVGRFNNRDKARARELESRLRSEGFSNAYTTPQ